MIAVALANPESGCTNSITTASGTKVKPGPYCSWDLIFEDNFNTLDFETWEHENTLSGGGNWEFQWYQNNRSNSYCENGIFYIRPTLLADERGEAFLSSGILNIHGGEPADQCTNPANWGCERTGNPTNIINPIKSARIDAGSGFWNRGNFGNIAPGTENPWIHGTRMAPFDQEFYIIMNLAVGGTNGYFPDVPPASNANRGKPWLNNSPTAARDFWTDRNSWLPTWRMSDNRGRDSSLQIDYVRVWAL
uniref:GH16 domain-containing protein n=1 Tax=Anopheles farauti TaxID=69004 RepID=A0A182QPU1_9DIPT